MTIAGPALRLLVVAVLAASGAVRADEPGDASKLRLGGFGTLGVVHSDNSEGWGFRRDAGQPEHGGGTRFDTDSRLGVQANLELDPRLELVGQLQFKRRPQNAIPADSVEWAFAAWRPTPELTVRLGRVSPDLFLLTDYRSVGFAYPTVRPNVETYGRLPITSLDGADVARAWDWDGARWTAKLFLGTGHARQPSAQGDGIDLHLKGAIASLVREADGLTLRGSLARFRVAVSPADYKDAARQALGAVASLPLPAIAAEARSLADGLDGNEAYATYYALGASYDHGPWIASAEAVHIATRLASGAMNTGYVLAGRRIGAWTPFAMAGFARSTASNVPVPHWTAALTPIVGPQAAAGLQAAGAGIASASNQTLDQRSASIGVRWDATSRLDVKLQWDRILVRANGGALWGRTSDAASHANVATAVMDFVF